MKILGSVTFSPEKGYMCQYISNEKDIQFFLPETCTQEFFEEIWEKYPSRQQTAGKIKYILLY